MALCLLDNNKLCIRNKCQFFNDGVVQCLLEGIDRERWPSVEESEEQIKQNYSEKIKRQSIVL
jgi:hypothetical protein